MTENYVHRYIESIKELVRNGMKVEFGFKSDLKSDLKTIYIAKIREGYYCVHNTSSPMIRGDDDIPMKNEFWKQTIWNIRDLDDAVKIFYYWTFQPYNLAVALNNMGKHGLISEEDELEWFTPRKIEKLVQKYNEEFLEKDYPPLRDADEIPAIIEKHRKREQEKNHD